MNLKITTEKEVKIIGQYFNFFHNSAAYYCLQDSYHISQTESYKVGDLNMFLSD